MTTTETSVDVAERRAALTAGMREAADWLDAHPELPLPYLGTGMRIPIHISEWDADNLRGYDEPLAERFAAAVRALGGERSKKADSEYMEVSRSFGPGLHIDVWTMREEVCEAVVVGTEQVEVDRVITPAVIEKVVEERDVIEWRCAPLLGTGLG